MAESRSTGDSQPGILVVDPSKVVLVAARKLLEPHFAVYLAENGGAALELVESIPEISAIFTEQTLQVVDGLVLLQRLRESKDPRIADLPVIITTSSERDEGTRRAAMDAGATDFIRKPFDAVDLLTRARAWSATSVRATALRMNNDVLRELVLLDADTRAGNREYFLQESTKDRSFCLRRAAPHALLYISIDNHERIQREQGRVAAREAIALVAEAIRSKCRREDTFARVSDSAFALSLLQTDHLGARVLAERIRQAIGLKVFKPRGMAVTLTVSIGVSVPAPDPSLGAAQVLEGAERAAKQASRAGGNQTSVINDDKTSGAKRPPSAARADAQVAGNYHFATDQVLAEPQEFIDTLFPLLQKLADSDRLALIDRLLVMAETPSES